jgi:hypothetical protein
MFMQDFIDLRGASGAAYRFRVWPDGASHLPIAGNYVFPKAGPERRDHRRRRRVGRIKDGGGDGAEPARSPPGRPTSGRLAVRRAADAARRSFVRERRNRPDESAAPMQRYGKSGAAITRAG